MSARDTCVAVMVAVIWGIAFAVSKVGLESFSPSQLTALRFLIAAIAVLWLPKPDVSWTTILGIGLTVFAGQFLLQFFGMAAGMPAGLTAVATQTQALFTVVFAALVLKDMPRAHQVAGMIIALAGLGVIGLTLGASATAVGFALTLGSAISWALGNLLIKRLPPRTNMLNVMVWASLVPPLPALAISVASEGPTLLDAITSASWVGIAAPIYLGLMATVLAYALWGRLMQKYSTAAVAPFALLAPCVGAIASAFALGEQFPPIRLVGIALILAGVATVVVSPRLVNPAG